MKPVDPKVPGGLPTPAAVYLLQRRDGLRFKIGWALEPVLRVQRLPEFNADELDLDGSHAVWLPTVIRAQQFERALHRGLASYRVAPSHTQEGHTEWFLPEAHRTAIRLIRQMPVGADARLPPPVVAFLSEPGERPLERAGNAHSAVVILAQDALWVMEDLLLRVVAHCGVAVESDGDCHAIRLLGFRGRVNGALETLRWSVLDIERYRWRTSDQAGAFVHMMSYEGDDLVLKLTPMRHVRTWADRALVWQVLALLERLRSAPSRPMAPKAKETLCVKAEAGKPSRVAQQPRANRRSAP
jgi:hypothetical protein